MDHFEKLNLTIPIYSTNLKFLLYSNNLTSSSGKVYVNVSFKYRKLESTLFLVPAGHDPILDLWIIYRTNDHLLHSITRQIPQIYSTKIFINLSRKKWSCTKYSHKPVDTQECETSIHQGETSTLCPPSQSGS